MLRPVARYLHAEDVPVEGLRPRNIRHGQHDVGYLVDPWHRVPPAYGSGYRQYRTHSCLQQCDSAPVRMQGSSRVNGRLSQLRLRDRAVTSRPEHAIYMDHAATTPVSPNDDRGDAPLLGRAVRQRVEHLRARTGLEAGNRRCARAMRAGSRRPRQRGRIHQRRNGVGQRGAHGRGVGAPTPRQPPHHDAHRAPRRALAPPSCSNSSVST